MASKSLGTLTLDLVANTAGFVRGMDKAERSHDRWKRKVKRNLNETAKAFKVLGVVAATGTVAAFAAVTRASIKQENSMRQIEQRLKSTEGAVGKTADELFGLASALQKTTTFGDEAINEMQGMLLTFTDIRGEVYERTVPAILDLSVAMNQDLKSSAVQLGKALNDPIANLSALSRTGIQFTEEQKKTIKSLVEMGEKAAAQNVILAELERQFGGAAEAAADTFGGALQQVQNAFGDLLENPGGLKENKEALQELTEFLQDPETVQAANALTQALITGFTKVAEGLRTTVGLMQFLGEEFAAITAGASFDDVARLEEQLALARSALENPSERLRFFGPGGLVEYWDEDELNSEISRLESAIDAAYKRIAEGYKARPIPVLGGQPGSDDAPPPLIRTREELEEIAVLAQKIKRTAAFEALLAANEEYFDLVKSLRTEEETINDTLRERLAIIDNYSGKDKGDTASRAIADAFGGLPDVGGLAPEIGGPGGELQRLNEEEQALNEAYQMRLELLNQFRQDRADLTAEWDAQELELKRQHEEGLLNIERSRQQATLVAAEDLFGSLADITKQFAGEQSAAYKVLFAIEKGAAIARSIVAIQTAIAQAATAGPFPANLAAMASVASATAGLISTIASTTIQGQAHDGLMSVPRTGTYLLEKGERVTTAETSAKLDRKLDSMGGGGVNIHNHFDAQDVIDAGLGTASGERAVMNIVTRNARTVRGLVA